MSDSPEEELFELDSEEDDDIVTQRLRRASKARRSARKAEGAPPETAPVSERGTLAAPDDDDSDFEIDPPDDDIFARRRRRSGAKVPAPAGTGRWFLLAIVIGVVAGAILGAVLLADDDKSAQTGIDPVAGIDMNQVVSDIDALEAQLANDPENYEVHVELGRLLCMSGNPADAFQHLTTATGLAPDRQEGWLMTGMCHIAQSPPNTAEAQRVLTKAVELDPDSKPGQDAQSLLDMLSERTEPADGESP
ncbi:MAG: hypothetical protein FWH11_01860 [Micrococcales bacterium]|nr:hypothetical protein [Micrococcales bacterium]